MIEISEQLKETINADSQRVIPKLRAWLADMRYLDNPVTYSTSESFKSLVMNRDPIAYLPLGDYRNVKDVESGITKYLYDESGNGLNLYPGSNSSFPGVLTTTPTRLFYVEHSTYEQLITKRAFHLPPSTSSDTLGPFSTAASVVAQDPDMQFFSWSTNNTLWKNVSSEAQYAAQVDPNTASLGAFMYVNSGGLDGFVDWRNAGNAVASGGVLRYVDDQNFIIATSSAGGTNAQIIKVVGGVTTVVATAAGGPNATNYYRFKARGNTFTLYNLGTSEPSNATSETSMVSAYIDDDVFKTEDAYNVGFGSHSISGSSNDVACRYFAFYMYNFKYKMMDFDGSTNFLGCRDGGGLDASSSIERTTFEGNFAIVGSFKISSGTLPYTVMHKSVDTSPKIHQWRIAIESDNKLTFSILDKDTKTYYEVKSTTSISNGVLYSFAISFDGFEFSIFINGVKEASTAVTDPGDDDDAIYPSDSLYPSSSLYPQFAGYTFKVYPGVYDDKYGQIFVGADNAGTTFGEANNPHYFKGRIGELAILGTDLSAYEAMAFHLALNNSGDIPYETVDEVFNSKQVINGVKEETFHWAVANSKDKYGNIITADGEAATVGDVLSATDNYGWMGRIKSDVSGNVSNEYVGYRFDARPVNKIRVTTGLQMGGVKNFTLYYIDEDEVEHSVSSSFAQFESYKDIDLGATYDLIEIKVVPTSTWNQYDYARIYGVDPIYEVDLSDYVISADVQEVRENLDATLPIGSTAANTLALTLDNTDLIFNPYGDSPYAPYIRPDTELFFGLAWELPSGEFEEVKMGDSFYVDTWGVSEGSLTITPSARDYSKYLQEGTVNGYLGQYITAGKACAALMKKAGFPARKINYYKTHAETIAKLKPLSWFKFSDSEEDAGETGEYLLDQIGFARGNHATFPLSYGNPSLVPSDSLVVTSDVDRRNTFEYLTFEPVQDIGSVYVPKDSYLELQTINTSPRPSIIVGGENFTMSMSYREVDPFFFNTPNPILSQSTSLSLTMKFESNGTDKERYIELGFTDTTAVARTARSESTYAFGDILDIVLIKNGLNYKMYVNGVLEIDQTFSFHAVNSTGSILLASSGSGQFSSLAFFTRALSDAELTELKNATNYMTIPTFRYLYATDESYWDAMLSFATADLGMFYFDRDGAFRYEYRDVIHRLGLDSDATMYELSDTENIIDGSQNVEVQVNKVNVNINSLSSLNTEFASIWSAETGESLAVSTLESFIDANSTTMRITSTSNPVWLSSGLVKIDDEIMSYSGASGGFLTGLQRGQYGTVPASHNAGAKAREARYYEAKYSEAPALAVRYPFITAEWLYGMVNIDLYYADSYKARILVSAGESAPVDSIVLLEGTNPLTELDYNFRISGIPVSENQGKSSENIEVEADNFANEIRKYRLKEITIDNKFITTKAYASLIASFVLSYYSTPVPLLNLSIHGVPHIQLGDIIEVTNFTRLGIENVKYWIIENKISYNGGIRQDLVLHRYVEYQEPSFSVGAPEAPATVLFAGNNINYISL